MYSNGNQLNGSIYNRIYEYNYGIQSCVVTIIDIHYDKEKPYYTVKFSDGKQRQTTLDRLTFPSGLNLDITAIEARIFNI